MYLGFNCYMRDAAAALLDGEGRVVLAVEEERLSRQKHTGAFPEAAIRACLDAATAPLEEVAFNMRPWEAIPGRFVEVVRELPHSLAFGRTRGGDFWRMCRVQARFRGTFGDQGRFRWVRHHEAHAASAFYFSPFDSGAVVLVADGSGELASTTTWLGEGTRLKPLASTPFPHSLGYFYSALTEWLGFPPAADEGTAMGLSSYGRPDPRLAAAFREAIGLDGRIDRKWFRFHEGGTRYFGPRWEATFGPARAADAPVTPYHEDVAAAGQRRLEEVLLAIARPLRSLGRYLCLAGGVALNCVANTRLIEECGFDEVFIQPAAGDSGTALGAAAARLAARGRRPAPLHTTALGPRYDRGELSRAIAASGLTSSTPEDPAADAAERLAQGAVVGWFSGRSEFGPRALGHRSILADPREAGMRDRVNAVVKRRERFRPFAPAFLAELAAEWLDGPVTPFMTTIARVRPHRVASLGAVTHVDGTARAQAVDSKRSPELAAVIRAFHARTGVPAVLNTSFNLKGEPIVERPEEALADLVNAELDAVYLDGVRVDRPHR